MRFLLVLVFLFYASSTFAGWVDAVGILERPTAPSTKPNMGIVWVDKLTKDLMFIDSDGLQYNILLGGGIGGAKLNDLSDVDTFTASPTAGNVLGFDGFVWKPSNISSALSGLSDVDLTTVPPTTGKVLGYDGSKWVPAIGGKNLVAGNGITINQDATTATISSSGKALTSVSPIVITQDATTATFSFAGLSLGGLIDVDLITTPPTANKVLGFDGSKWVPAIGGKNLVAGNGVVITQDTTTATFTLQNITASGTQTNFTGNTQIPTASYVYYGDSVTDGSYRVYQSGGALITEKRVSGAWVETQRTE